MCWPHPYICVGLFTDPLRRKLCRGMVASLTVAQTCNACNRRGRTSRSRGDALPALNQAPPPTIEPRTAWQRRSGNCNCKENHMLWWREYPYLLCKRRSLWIPTWENSTASDENRNLCPRREWPYNRRTATEGCQRTNSVWIKVKHAENCCWCSGRWTCTVPPASFAQRRVALGMVLHCGGGTGLSLRSTTTRRAGTWAISRSNFWKLCSEGEKDRDDVLPIAGRSIKVRLDTFKYV